MRKLLLVVCCLAYSLAAAQTLPSARLMYVGTIDKKLLILDEVKEAVVGEIQLGGIPRTVALSPDKKKLHIVTTMMLLETVDLETRQVISSFSLNDPRTRSRIQANAPSIMEGGGGGRYSGIAVDPGGRFLYTTMRNTVKELDQYRIDPPQFVAIDLEEKRIAKALPFPKDINQGFGFNATYKVSADGKRLYVFQEDILIFDLETFKQVDRIALAQPPFPGASPYRLAASDDPFEAPDSVTSVFTSVDPVVHKGTIGIAKIDLTTRKVDYFPVGPLLPMQGFQLSPDRKRGYSVMPKIGVGANREAEWWVWDIENRKVIRKKDFEVRPSGLRFAVSSDGKKLFYYGAGSTMEVFDAETLESRKVIYLNKDTTTNLITLPQQPVKTARQ